MKVLIKGDPCNAYPIIACFPAAVHTKTHVMFYLINQTNFWVGCLSPSQSRISGNISLFFLLYKSTSHGWILSCRMSLMIHRIWQVCYNRWRLCDAKYGNKRQSRYVITWHLKNIKAKPANITLNRTLYTCKPTLYNHYFVTNYFMRVSAVTQEK